MTPQQFNRLRWFGRHGGRGRVIGNTVVMADQETAGAVHLVTFVHLVASGALAGADGQLHLTEYGRRCIERTETGELL